jgi:hypothetical protein
MVGADIKATQTERAVEQGAAKETGSYTNLHESGRTYSGKGDRERSQISGRRVEKETGDRHIATDWTPSADSRTAFKDESRRIDANGGVKSDTNYNKIESPGKKLREIDGELLRDEARNEANSLQCGLMGSCHGP